MTFAHPEILIGLPLIWIAWMGLIYYQSIVRKKSTNQWASPQAQAPLLATVSPVKSRIKGFLWLIGLSSLIVALGRPQHGVTWQEVNSQGLDVLILLDVSKSMLAEDVKPNRLQRAKLAILELTDKLAGNNLGLIPFAGSAFLLCPLTLDHSAFKEALAASTPRILPVAGTDIAKALQEAISAFPNGEHPKIILLFSDGEDLEGDSLATADALKKAGITLYTVGIGTASGELIPFKNNQGNFDYQRDSTGKPIQSRLDEAMLKQLAEKTGGFYTNLSVDPLLTPIYNRALAQYAGHELQLTQRAIPNEQFMIPLDLALIALTLEALISRRRRASLGLLMLLGLLPNEDLTAAEAIPSIVHYNTGVAAFEAGNFNDATQAFTDGLLGAPPALQAHAYYNRGNSEFEEGSTLLDSNPSATLPLWEAALQDFDKARSINPQDIHARENYEILEKAIEDLKKELENQESKNDESSSNSENNQPQQKEDSDKNQESPQDSEPQREDSKPENSEPSQDSNSEHQDKPEEPHNADSTNQEQPTQPKEPNKKEPEAKTSAEANNSQASQAHEPQSMTPAEAAALLEAQKSQERLLPLAPTSPNTLRNSTKDW